MKDHYTLSNVSKKELVNIFELTEEDARTVHKYRNQLPVIIDSEGDEGFCVDMRELHKQLKVKSPFRKWANRRILSFIEGEDQRTFLSVGNSGGKPQRNHMLTVDTAKQVAMMENTDIGRMVRKYFILCEKIVLRMSKRNPIRNSCKESSKALFSNIAHRVPKGSQAAVIAEMHAIICDIATGARPSAWKKVLGVNNVRDFLKENSKVSELKRYDEVAQMAEMLSRDTSQDRYSVRMQLERTFGESQIYFYYLNQIGVRSF